ncbi:MAG: hypothetical protein ACI8X3_003351 [Saprospiraceae bacterium]|jgi:hypothetical protein
MVFFKNRTVKTSFLIGILLSLWLCACNSDKGKNIPDVSHIEVKVKIKRFEKDLMTIDTNLIKRDMDALVAKYPIFLPDIFFPKILPILQDTTIMKQFLISPGIQKLYDTCMVVYNDPVDIEKELESAFRFYKYYFPNKKVPEVISFFSEYTIGNFTLDDEILGIGWDFFLGADYPYYDPGFFPNYIKRTMNKEHLVAKSMEAIATDIVGDAKGERLIDKMITNGKVLYLLDQFIPNTPDSIKLAYTAVQTVWCENNEAELWSYFLVDDLLYSSNMRDIRKLVDYSPFGTSQMPPEAPGRSANWMGWQIVKSYMKQNPLTTLDDLIAIKESQTILDKARYKPRR